MPVYGSCRDIRGGGSSWTVKSEMLQNAGHRRWTRVGGVGRQVKIGFVALVSSRKQEGRGVFGSFRKEDRELGIISEE